MNRPTAAQPDRQIAALCFAMLVLCWVSYLYLYPYFMSQMAQWVRHELMLLNWLSGLPFVGELFSVKSDLAALSFVDGSTENGVVSGIKALKALTHWHLVWLAMLFNAFGLCLICKRAENTFVGGLSLDQLDVFISRFYYPSRPVVGRGYQDRHPTLDTDARFALKPWEFACQHHLLLGLGKPYTPRYARHGITLLKPEVQERKGFYFDRPKARRVFQRQLGPPLRQVQAVIELAPEYRALLIVLLIETNPQLAIEYGKPDYWLKQFASSFWDLPKLLSKKNAKALPEITREGLNMQGVDDVLRAALQLSETREILSSSGYLHSLLARLMAESRLSSAKLVWIKPINRTLFYVLNNAGRPRRLFVEGHAAYAHAEAERIANKALQTPQIDASIDGLELELVRHHWLSAAA